MYAAVELNYKEHNRSATKTIAQNRPFVRKKSHQSVNKCERMVSLLVTGEQDERERERERERVIGKHRQNGLRSNKIVFE
jgi:hypothetical protein